MQEQSKITTEPQDLVLRPTSCPICQTPGNAAELYPANFAPDDLNPAVFSARRLPDRLRYRIVKCKGCGLVRADPIAAEQLLASLYADSEFAYGDEVDGLVHTYGRYLDRLAKWDGRKESLLEIGCGNGFFLEAAQARGYMQVRGVEPSAAAVDQANATVQPHIVRDVMRPGLFAADSFDVICLFQVFDHIADPSTLLEECRRVLKPDGLMLFINHNIKALSAQLLKELSPIVDIEHTFLYEPATQSRLLEKCGFAVAEAGSVFNTYSLYYLLRLLPLPTVCKAPLLRLAEISRLGRLPCRVPLGNLYLVARKPAGGQ
jgi:SAM-dependent methyltransferase